ncbi:MAG: M55 family metallopeptidase [Oscillospiraceae bacterium]|nr:M55 family metallopeptidase [Oscillospiraceae bacterium]
MKVFITTDMEGLSGVDTYETLWDGDIPRTPFACERLMADTNAAAAGCFDAGAETVYVLDGHNGGVNFIDELLDPRAVKCTKSNWQEVIASGEIGAFLMVGFHAKAGTLGGFLDHTQSSKSWFNYYINGEKYGEIAQEAVFAGAFGIPCVMVSGDRAVCAEARQLFGNQISLAIVKEGTCRNITQSIPLPEAEALIRESARTGVLNAAKMRPFTIPMPSTMRIEFYRSDYCDNAMKGRTNTRRIDARTIEWTVDKIQTFSDVVRGS